MPGLKYWLPNCDKLKLLKCYTYSYVFKLMSHSSNVRQSLYEHLCLHREV